MPPLAGIAVADNFDAPAHSRRRNLRRGLGAQSGSTDPQHRDPDQDSSMAHR
jgi:hypothetical protein